MVVPHAGRFGGIKVAHQWAHLLNDAGYPSCVAEPHGMPASWMVRPAPTISWDATRRLLRENDTLVFCWMDDIGHFIPFPTAKVFFFAQDTFQAYRAVPGMRYLAVSRYIREHLREALPGAPVVPIVPNSVDPTLFRPRKKRADTVAYFSRRGLEFVRLASARLPHLRFVCIDGDERRVAKGMSECSYFVFPSLGVPRPDGRMSGEAFPLPPLEAMAAGCVVIGFAAGGGLEYMADGANCLLAPDGDFDRLYDVLASVSTRDCVPILDGCRQTAIAFSPQRTAEVIVHALQLPRIGGRSVS